MVEVIIILGIDLIALIMLGITFGVVEKNEDLDTIEEQKRNDLWHTTKWIFLAIIFTNIAYTQYHFMLETVLLWVGQFALVPLVFNPAINLYKGNGYLYLSDEGKEGIFKKLIGEKLYYLLWVLVLTSVLIWIE